MIQRWRKLGQVFRPAGDVRWMASHAALPTPVALTNGLVRVFFSCRDAQKRSHLGFVDIELGEAARVVALADAPLLAPGPAGAFDDVGVSLSSIVGSRAYYFGWNRDGPTPWRNAIGLAEGDPQAPGFEKAGCGLILDRSAVDPLSLSYPFVMADQGQWRMWYLSVTQMSADPADMRSIIRHAVSDDSTAWQTSDRIVLDHGADETVVCRPWVLREEGLYRMWYCHRGEAYLIGYAESADGLAWTRRDDLVDLDVSPTGWDSGMICYPAVFDHAGRRYMVYNGDGYGETGFGVAVLDGWGAASR